jgi:hypothetical protein
VPRAPLGLRDRLALLDQHRQFRGRLVLLASPERASRVLPALLGYQAPPASKAQQELQEPQAPRVPPAQLARPE